MLSFADRVREELCELHIKKPCCRRALSAGMMLLGTRVSANELSLRLRYASVAEVARDALAMTYSNAPVIAETASHGHRYWELSLTSSSAARLLTRLTGEGIDLEAVLHLGACENCRAAFLRGVFFAVGTVSDPQKMSHLELLLPNTAVADTLSAFLTEIGYPPKRIARRNGIGLYYKDSSAVQDLITLMGAHSIIYVFHNARIEGAIRNDENRATNCVTKNIQRSVDASAKQMEAIGLLMEHEKLDSLDESLRNTALLRYRNPDATLDELREMHTPPISKSGLSHRLKRLVDAAAKYEEKTQTENQGKET